jgi:lipopolysaccharide heptosyltransferase II
MNIPDKTKKHLVIRFSSIGDILLTLPVCRELSRSGQVDFVTKAVFSEAIARQPCLTNIHSLNSSRLGELWKLSGQLHRQHYSHVVDLHSSLRSHILVLFLRLRGSFFSLRRFRKPLLRRFLVVKLGWHSLLSNYSVRKAYARSAGTADNDFTLHVAGDDEKQVRSMFGDLSHTIAIMPAATWPTKAWPHFAQLVQQLEVKGYQILITGGPNDLPLAQTVSGGSRAVLACGKTNLSQTAALLNQCAALICGDTGLMHMANLLHKPLVAIFGSTTRHLGFFPSPDANVQVVEHELSCRPCTAKGRLSCPKEHLDCLNRVEVQQVLAALEQVLNHNS